jgi:hypothetical protein
MDIGGAAHSSVAADMVQLQLLLQLLQCLQLPVPPVQILAVAKSFTSVQLVPFQDSVMHLKLGGIYLQKLIPFVEFS